MFLNRIVPAFLLLYYIKYPPRLAKYEPEVKRYYFFWGGRGSGKSYQTADYILTTCHTKKTTVLCAREIQKSIRQSVHALLSERISALGLDAYFKITATEIRHKNGSVIWFAGLQDHTADSIKSYQGVDICWIEEAHSISEKSLNILLPTIRKDAVYEMVGKTKNKKKTIKHQKSHFIFTYNRYMESDPVHVLARRELKESKKKTFKIPKEGKKPPCDLTWIEHKGPDAYGLFINGEGNQEFPEVLKKTREKDYKESPELADHVWGGEPIGQAAFSIFTRSEIRDAVGRGEKVPLYGRTFIGVDVARFGNDKTVMYKRKGNVVIERKEFKKLSTVEVVTAALEFGKFDPEVQYNIDDTGVGGGVTDLLQSKGWRVLPINFAQSAGNPERYDSIVSEMIFNIKEKIPYLTLLDIPELREELTGRTWYLTNKNKRAVESKKDFKERLGRSCDDMDAFILAFYDSDNNSAAADLGNVT